MLSHHRSYKSLHVGSDGRFRCKSSVVVLEDKGNSVRVRGEDRAPLGIR